MKISKIIIVEYVLKAILLIHLFIADVLLWFFLVPKVYETNHLAIDVILFLTIGSVVITFTILNMVTKEPMYRNSPLNHDE